MKFLKKIVSLRYEHNSFFHSSYLLRPPVLKSNLSPIITTPAIWYNEDVVMEQVLCGSWKQRDTNRILVFVFNTADSCCEYNLTIPYREYGILEENLPDNEEYELNGDKLEMSGILSPLSYKIYEFNIL